MNKPLTQINFISLLGDNLINALEKWQSDTQDPLTDPAKFARYTREVDSVAKAYERNAYARDPKFEWKYPEYFYESKNSK